MFALLRSKIILDRRSGRVKINDPHFVAWESIEACHLSEMPELAVRYPAMAAMQEPSATKLQGPGAQIS